MRGTGSTTAIACLDGVRAAGQRTAVAVTEHVPAISVQLPSAAELVVSVKVTVPPVGVASPATEVLVTVAVKVVVCAEVMALGTAATAVAVALASTVSVPVPLAAA